MFSPRRMTPVTPIATGTPTPSTTACTARRSPIGTTWNAALIDVRVVPSVAAMSAMRSSAGQHEEPERGRAAPRGDHGHHGEHDGDDGGIEDEAEAQSESPHQRTGEDREEEDVHEVEDRGVAGEEPGELIPAVLRLRRGRRGGSRPPATPSRTGSGRRAGAGRCPERRASATAVARPPARRRPGRRRISGNRRSVAISRPRNASSRGGRGEHQLLGRAEQREERDPQQAAEEEPDREPRHDAREALLHLPHVEEPARLATDEHEAKLERDRKRDEQHRRDPDATGDEDHPRRGVHGGERAER